MHDKGKNSQAGLSGGPLAYKGDQSAFSLEVFSVLSRNDQATFASSAPARGASRVTHWSHVAHRGLGKEVTPPSHPANPIGHLGRGQVRAAHTLRTCGY